MGDVGDTFRAMRDHKKELKMMYGIDCPDCTVKTIHTYSRLTQKWLSGLEKTPKIFLRGQHD